MAWFEQFGFYENPFDTELSVSAKMAVGLEKPLDELIYLVKSGSLIFVEGAHGSGKSVLLSRLARKVGRRAVYIDLSGKPDIRSAIRKKASFFSRLLGNYPKRVVLLVDDVVSVPARVAEAIKYFYDSNIAESVVLAGEGIRESGLPLSIIDRIGNRIVRLAPLEEEDAITMVRNRIGNSNVLEEDVIRKIYRMSGKNGKKFLQLCEEACKAKAGDLNG